MRPGTSTSVLAIAAAGLIQMWPAPASARPDAPDAGLTGQTKPAASAPLSMMNLTPTKLLVRPYDQVGRKPQTDEMPTVVSYKPFANGPVGSVGLVRFTASHALDSSELGNASAGQPGAPSQTLGANLLYAFH